MKALTRHVDVSAQQVFDVLSDGWLYPMWVVGASRMREVDDGWPAVGTRLHHSVGAWPLLLDDTTEVLESHRPRLLKLKARAWPFGEAHVILEIQDDGRGGSVITMQEDAVSGPGTLVPQPLRQLGIVPRNEEALDRLAYLLEGRR
ncbi:SRPBCC family protein [Spongisporangium articulatum]|uniref:SRPBCC family protein n=1 Tax=Spongisporangium articulatum TaxID=3362603 RepID=A0ABW8AGS4_9ACTN